MNIGTISVLSDPGELDRTEMGAYIHGVPIFMGCLGYSPYRYTGIGSHE